MKEEKQSGVEENFDINALFFLSLSLVWTKANAHNKNRKYFYLIIFTGLSSLHITHRNDLL